MIALKMARLVSLFEIMVLVKNQRTFTGLHFLENVIVQVSNINERVQVRWCTSVKNEKKCTNDVYG